MAFTLIICIQGFRPNCGENLVLEERIDNESEKSCLVLEGSFQPLALYFCLRIWLYGRLGQTQGTLADNTSR